MQEQNFEKQVQQTMEELSFAPSEPVWQKVESQIRGKKDKRRFIFWMQPLIFLGGGYFILLRTSKSSSQSQDDVAISKTTNEIKNSRANNNTSTNQINQIQQERDNSIDENDNTSSVIIEAKETYEKKTSEMRKGGTSDKSNISAKRNNAVHVTNDATIQLDEVAMSSTKIVDNEKKTTVSPAELEETADAIVSSIKDDKKEIDAVTNTSTPENANREDSVVVTKQPSADVQTALEKQDTATKMVDSSNVVKSIQLKNKWTVSFKAVVGVSTLSDDLNPLGSIVSLEEKAASNLYADRTPVQSSSNNFSNAAATAVVTLPPSPVHKDFSYAVGLDVRKKLRNRIEFVTGLQYKYFSTWQYVGTRVDNSLASRNNLSTTMSPQSFYVNSALLRTKYVTKYHFISVPLGLDYQLLKRKPFKLSISVEVSQLLSTNALYYDKAAAIYYQKESLFRNTQLFGTTALSYRLLNKKLGALDLGPQVQFGFTNLLAKNQTANNTLLPLVCPLVFLFNKV